eukprot:691523-Prymnesium_polylepis.1
MDALGRAGPPACVGPGGRCGCSSAPPHGCGITAAESITIVCGHHRAAGPSFDAANLLNPGEGRRGGWAAGAADSAVS